MYISDAIGRDYDIYKSYVRNRRYLFENESFDVIETMYKKLYVISELMVNFEGLDEVSLVDNFLKEVKNGLMISFDLLNMNYLNASKQILRSSIESFFRFSLSLSRYLEYIDNKANRIFNVTDSLKRLKSLYTCQKVFKLTSGTVEYFKDTDVGFCYNLLNTIYSELSGNVHVNSLEQFSPQKYLTEYAVIDEISTLEYCGEYIEVLNIFSICIIYLENKLQPKNKISKKQIQVVELELNEKLNSSLNNVLD